ncbi:MAG: DUF1566 domain-containing protein [Myxococcota bacterium]|jgi:hypothetical protein|nr:DUF1566 domain-containing protein [Myxococcota bacterium]
MRNTTTALRCLLLTPPLLVLLGGCLDELGDAFDPCKNVTCEDDKSCVDGKCLVPDQSYFDGGLEWQIHVPTQWMSVEEGISYCSRLDSNGTGWRLPTLAELRSLIEGCSKTRPGGACNVVEFGCLSESCRSGDCDGCSIKDGPDEGCYWSAELRGACGGYWSTADDESVEHGGWWVDFESGEVGNDGLYYEVGAYVRCVR